MGLNLHCLEIAFQAILFTSLKATLLAIFIWSIQVIFQRKLSTHWRFGLWVLVIVRLLVPFDVESELSLFRWIATKPVFTESNQGPVPEKLENISKTSVADASPSIIHEVQNQLVTGKSVFQLSEAPPIPAASPDSALNFSIFEILLMTWLMGMVVIFIWVLRSNFHLWQQFKQAQPVEDLPILRVLERCKARMKISARIVVSECPHLQSPVLFGVRRPRILLPCDFRQHYSLTALEHIFLHELAHFKRHDLALACLMTLLQILHWFNPVLWLAFAKMLEDRELACDALALSQLEDEQRYQYGKTLINLAEQHSVRHQFACSIGIFHTLKNLKRRIMMINHFKKGSTILALAALGLLIFLSTVFLGDCTKSTEIKIVIDSNKTVKVFRETVQVDSLGKFLKSIAPEKPTLVSLKPTAGIDVRTYYEVQRQMYEGLKVDKVRYINHRTKEEVQTSAFDLTRPLFECYGDSLFPRRLNGKYGYFRKKDIKKGDFETAPFYIQPIYESAGWFHGGVAPVKFNGKWGLIDNHGNTIVDFIYDAISISWNNCSYRSYERRPRCTYFHDDLLAVSFNGKWGYIDAQGNIKLGFEYEQAMNFWEGLALVKQYGKWGFINTFGHTVIPCIFEHAESFYEELALVKYNGKWGFINKVGEFVIQPQFEDGKSFSEGLAAVKAANDLFGYIDKTGQIVIEPQFKSVLSFDAGTAMVSYYDNPHQQQSMVIDKAGNFLKTISQTHYSKNE